MHIPVLTKREEELFELLKQTDTVAHAANKMKISDRTAYNMLYRLRKKYYRARCLVNKIEANKRSNRLIKMVLTDRLRSREKALKTTAQEQKEFMD